MTTEELYKMEYETVVKFILHYSTVRLSALTLILTIGMGAFAIYIQHSEYSILLFFSFFMVLWATLMNYYFGKQTAKGLVYLKSVWKYLEAKSESEGKDAPKPVGFLIFGHQKEEKIAIRHEMKKDKINLLFYVSIIVLMIGGFSVLVDFSQVNWQCIQQAILQYLIVFTGISIPVISIVFLIKLLCAR